MATPHSPRSTGCQNPNCPSQSVTDNARKPSLLSYVLLGVVQFYRYFISPLLAPRCRFYPTCSQYALDAIRLHGGIKGGWLAAKRIVRCHPLSEGGEDPVPAKTCHICKKSQKSDRL